MRDAYIATRDYQRALENLQFEALSSNFAEANKQLDLQMQIIDHNLSNIPKWNIARFFNRYGNANSRLFRYIC